MGYLSRRLDLESLLLSLVCALGTDHAKRTLGFLIQSVQLNNAWLLTNNLIRDQCILAQPGGSPAVATRESRQGGAAIGALKRTSLLAI